MAVGTENNVIFQRGFERVSESASVFGEDGILGALDAAAVIASVHDDRLSDIDDQLGDVNDLIGEHREDLSQLRDDISAGNDEALALRGLIESTNSDLAYLSAQQTQQMGNANSRIDVRSFVHRVAYMAGNEANILF